MSGSTSIVHKKKKNHIFLGGKPEVTHWTTWHESVGATRGQTGSSMVEQGQTGPTMSQGCMAADITYTELDDE